MNPDQVFITRFEPRLIHTYVMFIVIINSFHNNLLGVNAMTHTRPYLRHGTDVLPSLLNILAINALFPFLGMY